MRFFRIPALWLIFLCSLLLFPTLAQEGPSTEDWYYAFQIPGGRLVSFNLDGEVRTLLGADFDRMFGRDFEIAPDEFINVSEYDDELYISHVTPERFRAIPVPDLDLGDTSFIPLTVSYPDIVLTNSYFGLSDALLVNVETLQTEKLPRLVPSGIVPGCCRFSDDGLYLRYISADDDTGETARIIERTLATGEEREVAVLPGNRVPIYQVTSDGSKWLYRTPDEFLLINIDGTQRVLEQREGEERISTFWRLYEEVLYSLDFTCEDDCNLQYYPGVFPRSYPVPPQTPVEVMYEYGDGSLLANLSGELFVLRTDELPQYLGLMAGGGVSFYPQYLTPISDDMNLVVGEGPSDSSGDFVFRVLDMPQGEELYRGTTQERVLSVVQTEEGAYIQDFRKLFLFFSNDSDDVIVLPDAEQLGVQRFFPIQTERGFFALGSEGLYLYDQEADELTSLFEGRWFLLSLARLPQ